MRYRFSLFSISVIFLFSFLGVNKSIADQGLLKQKAVQAQEKVSISENKWCEYLSDPLWNARDAYDAAHMLIVPLEYAFITDNKKLKRCFSSYMNRLVEADSSGKIKLGRLVWLQHLHLVSRYMVLASDIQLMEWLLHEFKKYWLKAPAWLWGHDDFTGIRSRINWKLNTSDESLARSYYNVIFDEDYFALALGVDLYGAYRRAGRLEECAVCLDAKRLFLKVFTDRLDWYGEGWLIDVGRWRDHPDFAYSQYYRPPVSLEGEQLPPSPRYNVVIDSSHAHRYPSWLRSAYLAFEAEERDYIQRLQLGLRYQFLNVILERGQGTIPILRNYMDGHNGWFRWDYETSQGAFNGYGPYALSGTFALGWWSLLGGDDISYQYLRLANAFPLTASELMIYQDSSTRERHPMVAKSYTNGLMFELAAMAKVVSKKIYSFK